MGYPFVAHGKTMGNPWAASIVYSWVHGLPPKPHGMLMECPWAPHELASGYPWSTHGIPIGYLRVTHGVLIGY